MKMNNKIKPEKRENREPRFVLEINEKMKFKKPVSDEVINALSEYGDFVMKADIRFLMFTWDLIDRDDFKVEEKETERKEEKILDKLFDLKISSKVTEQIIKQASDQAEKFCYNEN